MATTTRTKDRALGKDKRGTSPANSQKVSSRQASSSSDHKEKASEKPIPNYLKPTISSRINEPVKLGNKKNNNIHEDNQKLLRRRSFDRPPSASPRSQKALISPCHKAVRSLPAGSKPIKTKRTSSLNNKELGNNIASASRKSSSSRDHTRPAALEHETSSHEARQEEFVKEVEEVVNKEEGEISEVLSDINVQKSETEEDVHVHVDDHDVESTEDEKINSCDISTCTSEDQNLILESHIDHDDQVQADTDQQEDQEKEEISKEETCIDSVLPEEIVVEEEAKILKETEEKDEEDNKDVSESAEDDNNNEVEEEKLGHGEEAASEGIKGKEGVEEESGQDDIDHGGVAKLVSKVQEGQEKKESPSAAYNDVIEETASKLMEKRKNKVKALVGAFETVIDYESAGSSKS